MRGVDKRWPPRNVSPDNQAPCTLQDAERALLASLPGAADQAKHAREVFDSLDKKKLRANLFEEQRQICVYCERAIRESDKTPYPIEHWLPLSRCPDRALHWRNLYLSCDGAETCDDAKANLRLVWDEADPDLPWPADAPYHDWVGFTSGGEAYVRSDSPLDPRARRALSQAIDDQQDGERLRRSILNLNHPALVAARKAAIDAERTRMERDFRGRHASKGERQARAAEVLAQDPYPAFVSIRVAWLRQLTGKNRG